MFPALQKQVILPLTQFRHMRYRSHMPIDRPKRFAMAFSKEEIKKFHALADAKHVALAQLIRDLLHREADAVSNKEAA